MQRLLSWGCSISWLCWFLSQLPRQHLEVFCCSEIPLAGAEAARKMGEENCRGLESFPFEMKDESPGSVLGQELCHRKVWGDCAH